MTIHTNKRSELKIVFRKTWMYYDIIHSKYNDNNNLILYIILGIRLKNKICDYIVITLAYKFIFV